MQTPVVVLSVGRNAGFREPLCAQGFQVVETATLDEAIQRLNQGGIDLILLDLEMPGCSRLEAFDALHRVAGGLPAVILADKSHTNLAVEAITMGAQDFLPREGLGDHALVRVIRKALARQKFMRARQDDRILLRTLLDHSPDHIYFKDKESRFLMVSRAQAVRFHLSHPDQAIGKTDHDFHGKEHADQARADEMEILRTGKPLVGIEEMETWADGRTTWVSSTKMPLFGPTGEIIGTFGISRDITQNKRDREALAARTRELEKKNNQIAEELKMARELQLAMLPQEFPCVPQGCAAAESDLGFCSFYYPSGAVSGDFFNVMSLSDHRVGVFICDVMGHDVRAALVTALVRALIDEQRHTEREPSELLAQINRSLFDIFKQTGATMYATAFYLIADVKNCELRFASAGHPDPLHICRQAGRVEWLAGVNGQKKGPALGLFPNATFPTYSRRMEAGDLVALYTDGLTETESPDQKQFTPELLAEAVQRRIAMPPPELFAGVISEIREFAGGGDFEDDICLVGMEVRRLDATR
jgi:sigma-B regulation protein RsbU (phosphoserine phosphatase)